MNQTKPKQTLSGQKCPICSEGHFKLIQIDHAEECSDSPALVVNDVWVDQCTNCHEVVYPAETTQFIECFAAGHADELSSHDLEQIRENLGLDQTEIGEILGLGSKSYHRWENGTQFPSRSMSYYIRVLAEFPDAFTWLRQRGWQKSNRLRAVKATENRQEVFPALARLESRKGIEPSYASTASNVNYPREFSRIGIK